MTSSANWFTSKERDAETGLDYFGARYYSGAQGRFISADPLYIEMRRLGDPQKLNLYAYGRNNPLKFTDPTGLDISCEGPNCDDYLGALSSIVGTALEYDDDGKIKPIIKDKNKKYSKQQNRLLKAINDPTHHVKINAIGGGDDAEIMMGKPTGLGEQTIAMDQTKLLNLPANMGGVTQGEVIGHETLEAYATSGGISRGDAHDIASKSFGAWDLVSNGPATGTNGNVQWLTDYFRVRGTSMTVGVKMELVTPIPAADFLANRGAQLPAYPISIWPEKKSQ